MRHPLGDCSSAPVSRLQYAFLPVEGENLHQIAVGPVHAGTIEPGHFRFTASGETVVRLEQRLGYVHKGVEALLIGAPLDRATQLAARASGDSTVAYDFNPVGGPEDRTHFCLNIGRIYRTVERRWRGEFISTEAPGFRLQ